MIKNWEKRLSDALQERDLLKSTIPKRAFGAGRNKDLLRLNRRIFDAREKLAAGIVATTTSEKSRENYSAAAFARWQTPAALEREKNKRLARDLKSLAGAMALVRTRIEAESNTAKRLEDKRAYGLAYYHENRETFNRRRSLPALFRAAIRHGQQIWQDERNPAQLETAFRKVLKRQERREFHDWADSLRKRFVAALKGRGPSAVVEEMAGAPAAFVRAHLESTFTEGMAWKNHGSGKRKWNVDHIRPMVSFALRDLAQQRLCFHWSNLQALWHEDNGRKSDKHVLTV